MSVFILESVFGGDGIYGIPYSVVVNSSHSD